MCTFHLAIESKGSHTLVKMSGEVTGTADFGPLQDLDADFVTLDIEALVRFNSIGVHRWLKMIARVCERAVVEFTNVGDCFLSQWLMIESMTGSGTISSMVLSCWCDECDTGGTLRVSRAQHFPKGELVADLPPCESCGKTMELDTVLDAGLIADQPRK